AKGKKVDRRADIWAFGVVLFEMLTGKQLFTGENISETLAAVMMKEPAWEVLPQDTPAAIRKLLRRCLEKDPKQRLQAIGEARIAISEFLADSTAASVPVSVPVAAPQPLWKQALPWAMFGLMTLAFVVLLWSPWESPAPSSPLRLEVKVSPEEPLFTG
ncbi:MAG: protein kinase, partial [Terriglobia bacterium]